MKLSSCKEANDYFEEQKRKINSFGSPFLPLFRGLSKSSYDLKSNLARGIDDVNKLKKKEKRTIASFNFYSNCLQKKGILVKRDFGNTFHNNWHLLGQMQHLEIPTRLMDWTMKWEIALLFSVCNPKQDIEDGAIYILKTPKEKFKGAEYVNDFDPFNLEDFMMINVEIVADDYESFMKRIAERRRSKQAGKFFTQSYENSIIPMEQNRLYDGLLEKVIIEKGAKESIRNELASYNASLEIAMVEDNKDVKRVMKRVASYHPFANAILSTLHL